MTNPKMLAPTYDQEAVQPMRDELIIVGFEELLTPEKVDEVFQNESGPVLLVINSVCGCAAGNARPGAMQALQHSKIPHRFTTVFAGQEKAAVARARDYLVGFPPSSPCIALLQGGKVLGMLQRSQIEMMNADQISETLTGWFDQYCSRSGPSIPAEEFARISLFKACGSTIPLSSPGR
ncbi:BrxA/BrxB family bacilliredoxin [bacterium]|nr:MAG: hypothetical protein UZ16_OP3001002734 [Candidatus Hinthialibacteria bacterium OLB16]MCK6495882.1 BrxA/BrxB family bacilliredoxin [bacterium]